ncbi:MAG TPA: hypothetical protein DDX19_11730 [Rhodopirellula baltica]|uniref:Uncharacterized protein n=1 Tax=Rhodopirellula baltica (strain DSM 10527 / NCIMB 13988 / SH1) TaxID=243090 RepID=Q7UYS8_RHOBA|nr:hypothetical protein [Rhodopirellula baltica]CAD71563.1 hypothetical protein RB404 [Rhodopirellula baltica SH 1]HBE63386.1 hypothetical protein [Rhodopirellula baltica]
MNAVVWKRSLRGSLLYLFAFPILFNVSSLPELPAQELNGRPLKRAGENQADEKRAEQAAPEVDLGLRSVTLHAAGKGWFEFRGKINGARVFRVEVGEFELDEAIRVSRILDPAAPGEIRMVSSRDPVHPPTTSPNTRTLGDLLVSMKGQRIVATEHSGKKVEGTLVAIEQRTEIVDEQRIEREVMTVLTETGLSSMWVDGFESIDAVDEEFRSRLREALEKEARPAELATHAVEFVFGDGPEREVTIGLMRSVPMWKVSYRIEGDQLIHRSIVENTSGIDWDGVELSLVDGSPVLFTMDLRSVLRARLNQLQRPSRQVAMAPRFSESLGRAYDDLELAGPGIREETIGMDGSMGIMGMDVDLSMGMGMGAGGMGGGMGGGSFGAMPGRASGKGSADLFAGESGYGSSLNQVLNETTDAPAGSTLELQFDSVDLDSGKTALLDTLIDPVSVTDVSVYRQSYHPTATLLCLEIENNTPALLPSGPGSVLAGDQMRSILGEVVLPDLAPSVKRLVGYAMDGGVRVTTHPVETTSEQQSIEIDEKLHRITIRTQHQRSTQYDVLNRSGDDRNVILEVPLPPRPFELQALKDKDIEVEKTDEWHRLRVKIPDGGSREIVTVSKHTADDPNGWGEIAMGTLERWVAEAKWNEAQLETIRSILADRRELEETDRTLEGLLDLRKHLVTELERISNQLTRQRGSSSFPREVIQRYQTELLKQENRLAQCEQRMQEFAIQRRKLVDQLGMDRELPSSLSGLKAFVIDTDLIPEGMSTVLPSETTTPAEQPKDYPFGSDPFGN